MIYYKINTQQYNEKYKKNNFKTKSLREGGYGIRKKFPFTSTTTTTTTCYSCNKKMYTFYMRNDRFHILILSIEDARKICKKENIDIIYDENNQNPLSIKNY